MSFWKKVGWLLFLLLPFLSLEFFIEYRFGYSTSRWALFFAVLYYSLILGVLGNNKDRDGINDDEIWLWKRRLEKEKIKKI